MPIRLSDEARRLLAAFTEETGVTASDCLVEDGTVTFVVPPGDMAIAIGRDGEQVEVLEARLDRSVVLIADADRPAAFVANALAPAAVYEVTLTDDEQPTAIAAVDPVDMGVAIGREGRRVERARRLAARHFDIADVRVVEAADLPGDGGKDDD